MKTSVSTRDSFSSSPGPGRSECPARRTSGSKPSRVTFWFLVVRLSPPLLERERIRTINSVERLNRSFKRRFSVVGSPGSGIHPQARRLLFRTATQILNERQAILQQRIDAATHGEFFRNEIEGRQAVMSFIRTGRLHTG